MSSVRAAVVWLTGLGVLALAGAARAGDPETYGPTSYWLPVNVSPLGQHIDRLFYVILAMTSLVCVAVFAVLLVFLFRYRHRPGRLARYHHGNPRLELVWTLVPTAILALTAAASQATWSRIKRPAELDLSGDSLVRVQVIGQQFLWNFHYPGADGQFGRVLAPERINPNSGDPAEQVGLDRSGVGADDLVSPLMVVPVNVPVLANLASRDVIHSFYLPHLRVKQDAVPGLVTRVAFTATRASSAVIGSMAPDAVLSPQLRQTLVSAADADSQDTFRRLLVDGARLDQLGLDAAAMDKVAWDRLPSDVVLGYAKPFDIVCAELCGQGHFKMRGKMYVVSPAHYQAFLARERRLAGIGVENDGY